MSKSEPKNQKQFDDSVSSTSSKWASVDLQVVDSFSEYGSDAVEQLNQYLDEQDRASQNSCHAKLSLPPTNKRSDKEK